MKTGDRLAMMDGGHQAHVFQVDTWMDGTSCEAFINEQIARCDGPLALLMLELRGMGESPGAPIIDLALDRQAPSLAFEPPLPAQARIALLDHGHVAVLLPYVGREDAIALGCAITSNCVIMQHAGAPSARVTVRAGLAVSPDHGDICRLLIERAELALRELRNRKAGGLAVFAPHLEQQAAVRARLRGELQRALHEDTFELHYQPQCDIVSGRLIGFEALLRWRHPSRGLLEPAQFLEVLEESAWALEADWWVLRAAAHRGALWLRAGRPLRIAVNISPGALRPALVDEVARALDESGLPPHFLEIEIPERHALHELEEAAETVRRLRRFGVSVALDDFGTGYASLNALQMLDIDRLKIDRGFVRSITSNPKSAAIVESLVGLQGKLGLRVLAEGIETEEQRALLASLGCREGQGFLFSRAVPAPAAYALIHKGRVPAERADRRAS